jgi:hypothetical protein
MQNEGRRKKGADFMGHARRWLAGMLLVVCTGGLGLLSASVVDAKGGKADGTGTVESRVRDVNKIQQTVYLMDGTLLWTNDAALLEQLAPGTAIRASFEDRAGRKFINRLEILKAP